MERKKLRFLVTGGGTGGHIYPALAVAGELRRRHPDAEFLYAGGKKGLESELVPREGYDFVALDVRGMERKAGLSMAVSAVKALLAVIKAMGIVRRFKPDAVVGTGGYASFPVGAAAVLCRRPLVLHEQNVYPGLANRLLGRLAKGVAISWPSSKGGFKGRAEVVLTGNPVRYTITETKREDGLKRMGLASDKPTVLIFGGSQGAVRINRAAVRAMKLSEGSGARCILATGKANFTRVAVEAKAQGLAFSQDFADDASDAFIVPYIHDMAAALAVSDIVVSRAGALTLAELTATGKPAVLVPHPNVPDDVQRKNADAMKEAGAALTVEDAELTGEALDEILKKLLASPETLSEMAGRARSMGLPDAASKVADLVERHLFGGAAR